MEAINLLVIVTLFAEGAGIAAYLLWCYHNRQTFGRSLLYLSLGALQYLQYVLANLVTIPIAEGFAINPGSCLLFPAGLLIVLLLYARKDAIEWRRTCYLLLGVNLLILFTSFVTWFQLYLTGAAHTEVSKLFEEGLGKMAVGTAALVLDVVILMVVYDRARGLGTTVRLVAAMTCALAADATLFALALSWIDGTAWPAAFWSLIFGKLAFGILYSVALAGYLWVLTGREGGYGVVDEPTTHDLFPFLIRLHSYSELRDRVIYSDETRCAYNRAFLHEELRHKIADAERVNRPLALLLVRFIGVAEIHPDELKNLLEALRAIDPDHPRGLPCELPDERGTKLYAVMFDQATQDDIRAVKKAVRVEVEKLRERLGFPAPALRVVFGLEVYNPSGPAPDQIGPAVMLDAAFENIGRCEARIADWDGGSVKTAGRYPFDRNPSPRPPGVSETVREGQAAFFRDLADLLKTDRSKWVAYHGNTRVRVDADDLPLYKLCIRSGYWMDDCVIRCIEPLGEPELYSLSVAD